MATMVMTTKDWLGSAALVFVVIGILVMLWSLSGAS